MIYELTTFTGIEYRYCGRNISLIKKSADSDYHELTLEDIVELIPNEEELKLSWSLKKYFSLVKIELKKYIALNNNLYILVILRIYFITWFLSNAGHYCMMEKRTLLCENSKLH